MSAGRESNPFSTRWTRPGAVPFLFPIGVTAESLVAKLQASGWRGQIIGPHGTGKSTLLATLLPAIEQAGRSPELFVLRDGQRRLPVNLAGRHDWGPATVVVIDGYEQLSRWSLWQLRWLCHRRGWGLLVTAHTDVGFPELFRTAVSDALARQIVARLQETSTFTVVGEEEVAAALARHSGDMRETLFTLYDLYESRRREPPSPSFPSSPEL